MPHDYCDGQPDEIYRHENDIEWAVCCHHELGTLPFPLHSSHSVSLFHISCLTPVVKQAGHGLVEFFHSAWRA